MNIYDNSINLLERYFTSPLSSTNAISFYQYYIMDTLDVEGDKCIELSFIPQNPQDFGFSGRLWVLDDGTYQVKRCLVNLPLRSSVNFISNMVIFFHAPQRSAGIGERQYDSRTGRIEEIP